MLKKAAEGLLFFALLQAFFFFFFNVADASARPLPREIEMMSTAETFNTYYSILQTLQSQTPLPNFIESMGCDEECLAHLQPMEGHLKEYLAFEKEVEEKSIREAIAREEQEQQMLEEKELTLWDNDGKKIPKASFFNGSIFMDWTATLRLGVTYSEFISNLTIVVTQNTTFNETTGQNQTFNVTEVIIGPGRFENVSTSFVQFNFEDDTYLSNEADYDRYAAVQLVIEAMDYAVPILYFACESLPAPAVIYGCTAWAVLRGVAQISLLVADTIEGWNLNVRTGRINALLHYSTGLVNATACKNAARSDLPYQGCNGVDDNCDLEIDDCAEDTVPPSFDIDQAALQMNGYFKSVEDAKKAVSAAILALDDCNAVEYSEPSLSGSCSSTVATVVATDACGNSDTASVVIGLDTTAPTITCKAKSRFIAPPNGGLVDIGYSYSASDDCTLEGVDIMVMMDEPSEHSGPDVMINRDFVTGKFKGIYVKATANPASDGRVYTIYATAKDAGGNTATCVHKVGVGNAKHPVAIDNGAAYMAVL